jgi:hypothetical protein
VGLGTTDGIEESIRLLMHDPDDDIRAQAALALYQASRGTQKEHLVIEALKKVADDYASDAYVRDSAGTHLLKLTNSR